VIPGELVGVVNGGGFESLEKLTYFYHPRCAEKGRDGGGFESF
jgi:RsiW-degrading membrane proteinase PrsW (M82 family)